MAMTRLQEQIIDALANDFESIEQIRQMLDQPLTNAQIEAALWELIRETFVTCYEPIQTELKSVAHPERQRLGDYWFALTKTGEQSLIELETSA